MRPIESAAVFGFSFALLLIYFISMLIPVVINRRISADLNEILENKVQERTEQLVLAQEKLTQSAKMAALGEMAGGIAHEINTPLGTISLISEQIQDLVNEDPLDRQALTDLTKTVSRTVQRITDIILGLRTFSRDGTNDRFENASVKQIIEDTLALCREKIKHAEVQIKVNAIDDNMTLFCRPVQISQVLLNLINNSCDALMPLHEKWIDISVESCNDTIEISVMDSGSGITESIQRKLYQPFFSTKPIGQGTGLGLSVSKGIIQSHKGTLSLDTTSRNTRFVFTLPKTDSMLVRNQGKHSA